MPNVLCLDTEPETVEALRLEGYTVKTGDLRYRTGLRSLDDPPHEFDLLICDLKRPARFDIRKWGRENDNFRCKIEESVQDYIINDGGRPRPTYELIKSTQIRKPPAGTFGPSLHFSLEYSENSPKSTS